MEPHTDKIDIIEQARAFAQACYEQAVKLAKDGDSVTQIAAHILDRRIKKQPQALRLALFELLFRHGGRLLVHQAIRVTRRELGYAAHLNGNGEPDSHNNVLSRSTAFMQSAIWGGRPIGVSLPPEIVLSGNHYVTQGVTMVGRGRWHLEVAAKAPDDLTPPEKYMTEEEMGRLYYAAQFKANKEIQAR